MSEETTKKWYESRTIIAAIVVVLATAVKAAGIEIDDTTQAQIVDGVLTIVQAVGGLVAIIGRVKADRVIK